MSEYFFLLTRDEIPSADLAAILEIVAAYGATFVYRDVMADSDTRGWCASENLGEPFDGRIRLLVATELTARGYGHYFGLVPR